MDFVQNLVERIDPVLSTEEEQCTIIVKVSEFSNESIHRPNEMAFRYTDYDISSDKFRYKYPLRIYANGSDDLNEGYVSVSFSGSHLYAKHVALTCIIAVIDVEQIKRFLQSFTFSCDLSEAQPASEEQVSPTFTVDRYISRSSLLSEPSELLPNDTLTLHMDIILTEHIEMQYIYDINTNFVKSSFETEKGPDGPGYYLFLDSLVAERLREESTYFKRILVTPMTEKSTRYMKIPDEEYPNFVEIGCLLLGATSIKVQSINDIFNLYTMADKYDIGTMIDICRCLLRSCLSFDNMSEISEFADTFNDVYLKEITKIFLKNNNGHTEVENYKFQTEETSTNKEWICEHLASKSESYLFFKLQIKGSAKNKEDSFDFYH